MRTRSEMEEKRLHVEPEVGDIELGIYPQSTTATNEVEPGYDETKDADLTGSQTHGVETETESSVQASATAIDEIEPGNDETGDVDVIGSQTNQAGVETVIEYSGQASERTEMHFELYRAAWQGNWDFAEKIYKNNERELINHTITERGETALHIAASEGQTDFGRKVIKRMSENAIKAQDELGNTALCNAVNSGNVELAQEMLKPVEDLANIRGIKEMLSINVAALLGHKKMVSLLYDRTSDEALTDDERIDLLVTLIDNDIYDVALRMVEKHKDFLATARDGNKETALDALARKKIGQARAKCFNLLYPKSNPLPREASRLLHLLWEKVQLCDDTTVSEVIRSPKLTFTAARTGNSELLTLFIRSYPQLVFDLDENNCSIFHIAVLHRHEDVFKLIHEIGSGKSLIAAIKDNEKNNLLHLAAKLSPKKRLDAITGAVLQLQHDLLWFEVNIRYVGTLIETTSSDTAAK